MAYITFEISGNPSFGGYISIDKGPTHKIADGEVWRIPNGQHILEISNASSAKAAVGGVLDRLNGGDGLLDAIGRAQTDKSLGEGWDESWELQVIAGEKDLVTVNILTKETRIISAPLFSLAELTEEGIEACEQAIREREEEEERIRNTPRRSKGKIIAGVLLMYGGFGGCVGLLSQIITGDVEVNGVQFVPAGIMAVLGVVGILLFINGVKKKVRG